MRTLFFGSHNSHPSHPISALTVSSAHSILVPLAMVPRRTRNGHQIGEHALSGLLRPCARPDDGHLADWVSLNGERVHHPIDAGQRIRERKRQRLDTRLQRKRSTITAVFRPRLKRRHELDSTSLASSLVDSVRRDVTDPATDDLVERNAPIECNSGEGTGFRDDIVSFHIVRRVRFGVALSLCIRQRSEILEPLSQKRENVICGAIQDPTYCCDARPRQTFSDRAQYRSARHDCRFHATLDTPPPSELEQFDCRRSTGAFAGCDDVRAASKCVSNVAEGGLRFTQVSAARFGHHIALALSETFESAVPPTPARVVYQWAPRRDEFK